MTVLRKPILFSPCKAGWKPTLKLWAYSLVFGGRTDDSESAGGEIVQKANGLF